MIAKPPKNASIDVLKLEYEDRRDKRKWIKDMFQMVLVFLVGAGSGSGITALTMGDNKVEMAPQAAEADVDIDEPVESEPEVTPAAPSIATPPPVAAPSASSETWEEPVYEEPVYEEPVYEEPSGDTG